jgi:ribosomal protein S18 acetylase RimI-like enzyme
LARGLGCYNGGVEIRHAEPADHARVAAVIDGWWGGRHMRDMLPRLFFTHFRETSFVAEGEDGGLAGFLCGFLSQTYPDEAYVHFVGVAPEARGAGLARALYERFFAAAREAGRTTVRCVTSPVNTGSVAFHRRLGFEVEAEVENYDGGGESRVLLRRAL